MPQEINTTSSNIAAVCLSQAVAAGYGDKEAMVFASAVGATQSYTYRELDALSARFAGSLSARGVRAGERLLLRLSNTAAFPIAFFGALRAGVIPVPTSPLLTAGELRFILEDSGAVAIATDCRLWNSIAMDFHSYPLSAIYVSGEDSTMPQTLSFENELEIHRPAMEIQRTHADDAAYLVYTSGTTGYPKGVLHAHRSLWGRESARLHWFDFIESERVLHAGKFNWTYVLGTGLMDPLFKRKTVIVYEGPHSAERWVKLLKDERATTFLAVPTVFRQILERTAVTKAYLPHLRHAMSAGEHLTDSVFEAWLERFGFPIYEGLGMSECSYYISQDKSQKPKKNSAGKIQPGRKIDLLNDSLAPAPPNTEGMLAIHQSDPGLFLGYWNKTHPEPPPFKDGWFLTGDYAKRDAEGFIYFLGRRDDVIKSFGYRISPFEIERIFRDHIALQDVVAVEEAVDKEKTLVVLYIHLRENAIVSDEELLAWAKDRLAAYKMPKKIYRVLEFPRSANGKILRQALKKHTQ